MDTTEKNIMMCEKAEEIQRMSPRVFITTNAVNIPFYDLEGNCWFNRNNEKAIWLPRQDQLQDMAWNVELGEDNIDLLLMRFYTEIHITSGYWDLFRTMEQKWLAFLMKSRYNKVWNEKEWVKK